MRTTIRINDALYREVKQRAARDGRTVAATLEDAVRRGMESERVPSKRFVVRASGRGGVRPGVDLSSNASVAEALDEGLSLDELR